MALGICGQGRAMIEEHTMKAIEFFGNRGMDR